MPSYVVRGPRAADAEIFNASRKYKCRKGGLQESTPGFKILDPLFLLRQGEDESISEGTQRLSEGS